MISIKYQSHHPAEIRQEECRSSDCLNPISTKEDQGTILSLLTTIILFFWVERTRVHSCVTIFVLKM